MSIKTPEEFRQAVQRHLEQRENFPTIVIVHSPHGIEIQCNFIDFAMQVGILDIAKLTTVIAFEQQAREGYKTGENQMIVSGIKDIVDPDPKKRMN